MVMEAAKKLNFFPAKHGVSKYYSQRMILHQHNLHFSRHCKHALGEYVIGIHESEATNTNKPQGLDCLYLRFTNNNQGGHELFHLAMNRMIT